MILLKFRGSTMSINFTKFTKFLKNPYEKNNPCNHLQNGRGDFSLIFLWSIWRNIGWRILFSNFVFFCMQNKSIKYEPILNMTSAYQRSQAINHYVYKAVFSWILCHTNTFTSYPYQYLSVLVLLDPTLYPLLFTPKTLMIIDCLVYRLQCVVSAYKVVSISRF